MPIQGMNLPSIAGVLGFKDFTDQLNNANAGMRNLVSLANNWADKAYQQSNAEKNAEADRAFKEEQDAINRAFQEKQQKEKFDLKTLKPFDKVLVRNDSLGSWRCDLLSHFNKFSGNPLFISTQYCHECIPYNEDTKYLLGTKCEAPEYYKWWEE